MTTTTVRAALLKVISNIDPDEFSSVHEYWVTRFNATFPDAPYALHTPHAPPLHVVTATKVAKFLDCKYLGYAAIYDAIGHDDYCAHLDWIASNIR